MCFDEYFTWSNLEQNYTIQSDYRVKDENLIKAKVFLSIIGFFIYFIKNLTFKRILQYKNVCDDWQFINIIIHLYVVFFEQLTATFSAIHKNPSTVVCVCAC